MPEVKIHDIRNLKVSSAQKTTDGMTREVTTITFECDTPPVNIARLLNFRRQLQKLDIVIDSPQAEMDLALTPVSAQTGEILER